MRYFTLAILLLLGLVLLVHGDRFGKGKRGQGKPGPPGHGKHGKAGFGGNKRKGGKGGKPGSEFRLKIEACHKLCAEKCSERPPECRTCAKANCASGTREEKKECHKAKCPTECAAMFQCVDCLIACMKKE